VSNYDNASLNTKSNNTLLKPSNDNVGSKLHNPSLLGSSAAVKSLSIGFSTNDQSSESNVSNIQNQDLLSPSVFSDPSLSYSERSNMSKTRSKVEDYPSPPSRRKENRSNTTKSAVLLLEYNTEEPAYQATGLIIAPVTATKIQHEHIETEIHRAEISEIKKEKLDSKKSSKHSLNQLKKSESVKVHVNPEELEILNQVNQSSDEKEKPMIQKATSNTELFQRVPSKQELVQKSLSTQALSTRASHDSLKPQSQHSLNNMRVDDEKAKSAQSLKSAKSYHSHTSLRSVTEEIEKIEPEKRIESIEKAIEPEKRIESIEKAIEPEKRIESIEKTIEDEKRIESIEKTIEDEKRIESIEKAIEDDKPIESIEKAIEDDKPIESIEKTIEDDKPIESIEKAIEDDKPIESIEEAIESIEKTIEDDKKVSPENIPLPISRDSLNSKSSMKISYCLT
jgi:hypothetical protein